MTIFTSTVTLDYTWLHGDFRLQPACLLPHRPGTSPDLVLINHPMASYCWIRPRCTCPISTIPQGPWLSSCPFHQFCYSSSNFLSPLWLLITSIVSSGLQVSLPFCVVEGTTVTHIWASWGGGGLWGARFLQEGILPFDHFIYFSYFSPCLDISHIFTECLSWTNCCSRV